MGGSRPENWEIDVAASFRGRGVARGHAAFPWSGLERGTRGLRLLLGEQAQILGLSQGKEDVVVPALLTALLGESSASASRQIRRNLTP